MPTIAIGFNATPIDLSQIMLTIEPKMPEHENIWVWDHYYSLILFKLAENDKNEAQALLDDMSQWAVSFANKMYAPINELHAEGALKINKDMTVSPVVENSTDAFLIEVTAVDGSWPTVHAKIFDETNNETMKKSVVALAQYFLSNNTNFFRELPMHVLGMRKFYTDEMPFSDEASIAEAPAYTFNMALKFYEDLDNKLKQ